MELVLISSDDHKTFNDEDLEAKSSSKFSLKLLLLNTKGYENLPSFNAQSVLFP